jgi:hypothetical protein
VRGAAGEATPHPLPSPGRGNDIVVTANSSLSAYLWVMLSPLRGEAEGCNLGAASLMVPSRHTLASTPISCGYPLSYPRHPAASARVHPGTPPAPSPARSSLSSFPPDISPLFPGLRPRFRPQNFQKILKNKKKPGSRITDPRAHLEPQRITAYCSPLTAYGFLRSTACLPASCPCPWPWCRTWGRGCRSLFRPR